MRIKKAIITAAGRGPRTLPAATTVQKAMLPIEDRDGLIKPVIQIIAEEALDGGVEEICIVCAPGDEPQYLSQLTAWRENLVRAHEGLDWAVRQAQRIDELLERLHFKVQAEPLGYGHAVFCARDFVGDAPFLLLLGDHLYVSRSTGRRCAQQLLDLAASDECAAAAVQATREHLVARYGTVRGRRVAQRPGVYEIERIMEKPSLSLAELELQTPGLRIGHYLCFFGMHVLPPGIFDILEPAVAGEAQAPDGVQLTPALQELAESQRYLALEIRGIRYDIGVRFGLLRAQIALALKGKDRDTLLATLVDSMAEVDRSAEELARDNLSGGAGGE